jgi:surfeit locus 1 family protein
MGVHFILPAPMPTRLSAFGRVFAPSWPMTLLTLILLVLFVGLGRWQWHRGEAKQALWNAYERSDSPPVPNARVDFDAAERFTRVALTGRFDADHQFLLDNRSHAGKPGYEVLTPFLLDNGRRILVNRGWIPFDGYRDQLPDVSLPSEPSTIVQGRLDELPTPGLASGRAPPEAGNAWPKRTSFPTHDELEAALREKLARRILLLDPQASNGYVREWSAPGMAPERHFSYAIQWWGFAVVLLVLYFALNFRKVP